MISIPSDGEKNVKVSAPMPPVSVSLPSLPIRSLPPLASAKQQVYSGKCKKLTATEQACLRGLLCRYSPSEIARELHREPKGLRVDLCRDLYRYIEIVSGQDFKEWRDVSRVLAAAGYQTQVANVATDLARAAFTTEYLISNWVA